jgi:hypothetical protein
VLVVYAGALVVKGADSAAGGTVAYASTLVLNAALVAVAAVLWWLLTRARRTGDGSRAGTESRAGAGTPGRGPARRVAAQNALLLAVAAVAVWRFLMLGLAASALFLRPPLDRWIRRATGAALYLATFLLGLLLARGVHPLAGLVLGCATFAAQIVVGAAVTWGLPRRDRWALCLSQQNGITAIILALLLQPLLPEAIGIVAPAILVVNLLHLSSNSALGAVLGRTPPDYPGGGPDGRDGGPDGRGTDRDEPGAAGGPHPGSRLSAPA